MIKCNVSVCGTVSKAAVVRNGKDGMPFTTYSVDVVVPAKSGINKTVIVSCIMDGDDAEGIVVGNRIELKGVLTFKKKDDMDMDDFILEMIDYGVDEEFDQDEEEGTITIYGEPTSYNSIQKKLEADGFEDVGGEFTYIPNDLKEVTPEQRETINKMVDKLEEFDDVQTVYTNMKPEETEE